MIRKLCRLLLQVLYLDEPAFEPRVVQPVNSLDRRMFCDTAFMLSAERSLGQARCSDPYGQAATRRQQMLSARPLDVVAAKAALRQSLLLLRDGPRPALP